MSTFSRLTARVDRKSLIFVPRSTYITVFPPSSIFAKKGFTDVCRLRKVLGFSPRGGTESSKTFVVGDFCLTY
jgi:hypothetical protein